MRERCLRVVRDVHLVARVAEDLRSELGDHLLVVDDEHRGGTRLHASRVRGPINRRVDQIAGSPRPVRWKRRR